MKEPGLYRHRPTIVHALQFTPATADDIRDWLTTAWPGGWSITDDNGHLIIDTIEGDRDVHAADGYWIVEGIRHEFYPVRDDIFRTSYDYAGGE